MDIHSLLEATKKKADKKPSLPNFVAKHDHNKAATFRDKKKDYKRKPKHKKPLREDIETLRSRLTPLSKESKDARRPLPPEVLMDAMHNVVHKRSGTGGVANSIGNKIKKVLNETFDQVYPFQLKSQSKLHYEYVFKTDSGDTIDVFLDEQEDFQWKVFFERNQRDYITGEGDAFKIFGTVLAILKDFIQREDVEQLEFESTKYERVNVNLSRQKLYDRMVNKFAGNMGYDVTLKDKPMARKYILTNRNFKHDEKI